MVFFFFFFGTDVLFRSALHNRAETFCQSHRLQNKIEKSPEKRFVKRLSEWRKNFHRKNCGRKMRVPCRCRPCPAKSHVCPDRYVRGDLSLDRSEKQCTQTADVQRRSVVVIFWNNVMPVCCWETGPERNWN